MKFNITRYPLNFQENEPLHRTLFLFFEDHPNSPVSCTSFDTAEIRRLEQLLRSMFPKVRSYVLTHGTDCELAVRVEPTIEAYEQVAQALREPVIKLLEELGHQYDPNVLHYSQRHKTAQIAEQ